MSHPQLLQIASGRTEALQPCLTAYGPRSAASRQTPAGPRRPSRPVSTTDIRRIPAFVVRLGLCFARRKRFLAIVFHFSAPDFAAASAVSGLFPKQVRANRLSGKMLGVCERSKKRHVLRGEEEKEGRGCGVGWSVRRHKAPLGSGLLCVAARQELSAGPAALPWN